MKKSFFRSRITPFPLKIETQKQIIDGATSIALPLILTYFSQQIAFAIAPQHYFSTSKQTIEQDICTHLGTATHQLGNQITHRLGKPAQIHLQPQYFTIIYHTQQQSILVSTILAFKAYFRQVDGNTHLHQFKIEPQNQTIDQFPSSNMSISLSNTSRTNSRFLSFTQHQFTNSIIDGAALASPITSTN